MGRKAAIQLSINFLVVIIISLVIFGFGIKFLYDIFSSSQSITKMSQEQIDSMISDLMCGSNQQVCLSKDFIETGAGKTVFIGVNILNIGTTDQFFIQISDPDYFNPDGSIGTAGSALPAVKPKQRTLNIEPNKDRNTGIAFEIPKEGTKKGTYKYTLQVFKGTDSNGDKYDSAQMIRIIVK